MKLGAIQDSCFAIISRLYSKDLGDGASGFEGDAKILQTIDPI